MGVACTHAFDLIVHFEYPLPEGDESDTLIRQISIFVPRSPPFDGNAWAEGVLGHVIRPLVCGELGVSWFWFTRYAQPRSASERSEITGIPRSFAINGLFRSVRFCYALSAGSMPAFEERARALIGQVGARTAGSRDYDWLRDLGADRFTAAGQPSRRTTRAQLVAGVLLALCRLSLDCLSEPDELGRYRFEESVSRSNPHGSPFESLHHLFCNITAVPTSVLVTGDRVGTRWTPPPITDATSEKRVWF
jgi:hypothetical protein